MKAKIFIGVLVAILLTLTILISCWNRAAKLYEEAASVVATGHELEKSNPAEALALYETAQAKLTYLIEEYGPTETVRKLKNETFRLGPYTLSQFDKAIERTRKLAIAGRSVTSAAVEAVSALDECAHEKSALFARLAAAYAGGGDATGREEMLRKTRRAAKGCIERGLISEDESLRNAVIAYIEEGDFDQALRFSREVKAYRLVSDLVADAGKSAHAAGRPEIAKQLLDEALRRAGSLSDPFERLNHCHDIIVLADALDRQDIVENQIQRAMDTLPSIQRSSVHYNAAHFFSYIKGKSQIDGLYKIANEIGNSDDRARVLGMEGKEDIHKLIKANAIVGTEDDRAEMLGLVAALYQKNGFNDKADALFARVRKDVGALQKEFLRGVFHGWIHVARNLALAGRVDEAISLATGLEPSVRRLQSLEAVAETLIAAGELEAVDEILDIVKVDTHPYSPDYQVKISCALAAGLDKANRKDDAAKLLKEAFGQIRNAKRRDGQWKLMRLILQSGRTEFFDDIRRLAGANDTTSGERDSLYEDLVNAFASAGRFQTAINVAKQKIDWSGAADELVLKMALSMAAKGDWVQAFDKMRGLEEHLIVEFLVSASSNHQMKKKPMTQEEIAHLLPLLTDIIE